MLLAFFASFSGFCRNVTLHRHWTDSSHCYGLIQVVFSHKILHCFPHFTHCPDCSWSEGIFCFFFLLLFHNIFLPGHDDHPDSQGLGGSHVLSCDYVMLIYLFLLFAWNTSALDYKHVSRTNYAHKLRFHCTILVITGFYLYLLYNYKLPENNDPESWSPSYTPEILWSVHALWQILTGLPMLYLDFTF